MGRATALIRRFTDPETGEVSTFLTASAVEEHLGLPHGRINRWARAGAVRVTTAIGGTRNYALSDILYLLTTKPEESLAAGVKRTPAADRLVGERWHDEMQGRTRPVANKHQEEWSSQDDELITLLYRRGVHRGVIAMRVGRTYDAVSIRLRLLGEILEEHKHVRVAPERIDAALGLLTLGELQALGIKAVPA